MTSAFYPVIRNAVLFALLPSADCLYPGIGPALRDSHSRLIDAQTVDRLEWAGDKYLTYYLHLILEERPRFGGSLEFVAIVEPLLAENEILKSIMERSGLDFPGYPYAQGKDLADALEGTVGHHCHSHASEDTMAAVLDCFLPLIIVAEDAYEDALLASGASCIYSPPDERYRVKDLTHGVSPRPVRSSGPKYMGRAKDKVGSGHIRSLKSVRSSRRDNDENVPPGAATRDDGKVREDVKTGDRRFFADLYALNMRPPKNQTTPGPEKPSAAFRGVDLGIDLFQ